MPHRGRITAKEIAELCGVSQATVSYVMNNAQTARVGEARREQILRCAREHNYYPNAAARSIRRQDVRAVGLVSGRNYGNIGFGSVLEGIMGHLGPLGYALTVLSDEREPQKQEYARYYHSNQIGGIILVAFDGQRTPMEQILEHNIPYVIISEDGVWCDRLPPRTAFRDVICDCIGFCRQNGQKKIRYFTRQVGDWLGRNKYDLVSQAVASIYPESDFERIICKTELDQDEEITGEIERYLDAHGDFDIAITPSQRIGLLMQNCILRRDFCVPQNIRHICLSSFPLFKTIYPSVTSLNIPLREMGQYAAELMLALLEGGPIEDRAFQCTLVEGISTQLK